MTQADTSTINWEFLEQSLDYFIHLSATPKSNVKPAKTDETSCVPLYDPKTPQTIWLDTLSTSWITIGMIPTVLSEYGATHFDDWFEQRPSERAQVVMGKHVGEVTHQRWHASYGEIPRWHPNLPGNFMFSNKQEGVKPAAAIPDQFQPFLKFVGPTQNQLTVNWYQTGDDYIPQHVDATYDLFLKDPSVTIINLTPSTSETELRHFRVTQFERFKQESLQPDLRILLRHGCYIYMGGEARTKFRHGVPRCKHSVQPRISLSFRVFPAPHLQTENQDLIDTHADKF
jgi:alkylated DNA repair dioxygenase AlkB